MQTPAQGVKYPLRGCYTEQFVPGGLRRRLMQQPVQRAAPSHARPGVPIELKAALLLIFADNLNNCFVHILD